MKTYQDEFCKCFTGNQEYDAMKQAQLALEGETIWEDGISGFSVLPLATPMDAEVRANDPTNTIPKEILLDTVDNAGIMLAYEGKEVCLRSCALPSLQTTARISGGGISRVEKTQLAIGLTAFLTGARNHSRVLTRSGKVAAVLSAQYEWMPISTLLEICDTLEKQLGPAEFIGGSVSHALTVAQYKYPDAAQEITDAYNSILVSYKRPTSPDLIPVVEFRASDTSGEAAKMLTYLKSGGILIPLGGFGVVHVPPNEYGANGLRLTCMDKFREEAATLFSKMKYDIADSLPKMLDTKIDHPVNCFIGLCKYANIPQKWGGLVEEEIRYTFPDGADCSFLDIYEALASVTARAVEDGYEPYSMRVLELEEGICKVLKNRSSWKKYDLPGTVAWYTVKAA